MRVCGPIAAHAPKLIYSSSYTSETPLIGQHLLIAAPALHASGTLAALRARPSPPVP